MSKFDPGDCQVEAVEAYPVHDGERATPHIASNVALHTHGVGREAELKEYLTTQHWPPGLQEVYISNASRVGQRYLLIDDSGSMTSVDGHLPLSLPNSHPVSRWTELAESMSFHANALSFLEAETQVRFLNATAANDPLVIGGERDREGVAKATIDAIFDEGPAGLTPLCEHVRAIIADIQSKEQLLRRNRKKAVVVIATDGLSSDGDLVRALKPLERLPVWLVVRLCTDEDTIVESYNELDNELEVGMDVLDDFKSEAEEIQKAQNGWFTYGLPLHLLRESGLLSKTYDKMDESKLSHEEMREVCAGILGGDKNDWPHPVSDFGSFFEKLQALNLAAETVADPLQRLRQHKWIHETRLKTAYSSGGGCSIM